MLGRMEAGRRLLNAVLNFGRRLHRRHSQRVHHSCEGQSDSAKPPLVERPLSALQPDDIGKADIRYLPIPDIRPK